MVENFNGQTCEFSLHPCACRVVQKMVENRKEQQKIIVLNEVLDSLIKSAQHQHGNYVFQHCLQHSPSSIRFKMINLVFENIIEFSKHKCASNSKTSIN